MNSDFHECLAEGVSRFNAGHWYEAHEAWEQAWLRETGERRELLQGLIQVAAGCLQRQAGRTEGARTLFTRALGRLERLPASFEGVDVGALVPQVRQWREGGDLARPVVAWRPR
ncbi:MAG TPA: DUF309 domain-containing protein [Myxococcaceae bacterium]|jgi:hypothetical protein